VSPPVTPEPSRAKRISQTTAKEQDRGTFEKWLKQRKSPWKNKRKERKREATASLLEAFEGGVSNKRGRRDWLTMTLGYRATYRAITNGVGGQGGDDLQHHGVL